MQIRNNFNLEIKPYEWLYIITLIVVVILILRDDLPAAVDLIKQWIPKPK